MAEAGLQEVENYVSRQQNTVEKYIATRPIMELCLTAKRRPGSRAAMRWWEQKGMDLEGTRTADWEADHMGGGGGVGDGWDGDYYI